MSWMDFKMASAKKAQQIAEDSKRVQVGKAQKGTDAKATSVADDFHTKQAI